MNWDRAKSYVILFLCLLNIFMLACNFLYSDIYKYTLTSEQINDVAEVLQKNNITVSTDILKGYSPKKELELMTYDEYDGELLADIFMNNPEGVKFSIESDRKVLRTDWETLTINNGYVTYRNRDIASGYLNEDEAALLCKELIRKLEVLGAEFVLDGQSPYKSADGWVYEYRQKYKGNIIYSNFVSITVSDGGISRVDFMYARPIGYVNNPIEVCSADEALINFMHTIKNYFGNIEVDITQMDLVYYRNENASEKNLTATAYPYYRIYFSESDEPMLINAFTNTVSINSVL